MGRLEDRLLNHRSRERIIAIRGLALALTDAAREQANEESAGTLDRLPKVLDYIEGAFTAADPALVDEATLEAIAAELDAAEQLLEGMEEDAALATRLDAHLESAIRHASPLVAASPLAAARAEKATGHFDTALTETVRTAADQAATLRDEIASLRTQLTESERELRDLAETRENALTERFSELEKAVTTEKGRLDALVPNFESQFKTSQEERTKAFDAQKEQFETKSEKVVGESQTRLDDQAAAASTASREILDEVEEKRAEVEKLHGVITDTSTTGAFRTEATAQAQAADKWRGLTIVFGVLAALLAVAPVVLAVLDELPDAATSTSADIAKITATLAAAGVAAYAGRQSGRHRRREEEAKRLELELVAFPPFIDSLEEDQQREVRKQYIERAFRGRSADSSAVRRLFPRKDDSLGLLPELRELVEDVVDRRLSKDA